MLRSIEVACLCGTSIRVDTDRERGELRCPLCFQQVRFGTGETPSIVN